MKLRRLVRQQMSIQKYRVLKIVNALRGYSYSVNQSFQSIQSTT